MLQVADETARLNRVKGPYEKEAAIIRAKKLPKAMYGYEITPVNETALTVVRPSFIKCMTYTASRRSDDLVFSVASEGTDLDPDENILARRVAAFRRYFYKDGKNAENIREVYGHHKEKGEPGIYRD